MADYGEPINLNDYNYRRFVHYTNPLSSIQYNVVVKLILNSDNFNFDLPKEDGADFRITGNKNGVGTLKMWKAHWSKSGKHAVLFFKIPFMKAKHTSDFIACWGNEEAEDVSDPAAMNFLFYETFTERPLDSSKWVGDTNSTISVYGYYLANYDFATITKPLEGKTSWIAEAGIYCDWDDSTSFSSTLRGFGLRFEGTENDFIAQFYKVDRIATDAVDGSTDYIIQPYGGLEPRNYQDVFVSYYEPEDKVTMRLSGRGTYEDIEGTYSRRVEGDTRPLNVRVWGRATSGSSTGPHPSYISWFLIREYSEDEIFTMDGSELYVPYENVVHQDFDWREFLPDFTRIFYQHSSSFGGDPYRLSDEGFDADLNIWLSDEGASLEPFVYVEIHTGWALDVTSIYFSHYDSGHMYQYNASKLSDDETDAQQKNFFQSTTTSGWAGIKFPATKKIGAFRIKSTSNLNACPKNFEFYGSNFNPVIEFSKANKLLSGTFSQTEEWQSRVVNQTAPYRYYILNVLDTYGNDSIEIQEWEMMDVLQERRKRCPNQLRLHPALYGELEYNFPKEISLRASNNGVTWTTLLPWTSTYTPFINHVAGQGQWQYYSFINITEYWSFRLLCKGNWLAQDNRIAIGEWQIVELEEQAYTYRILSGTTNNIQQIWADDDCGIDDPSALIYLSNEYLNKIIENKRVASKALPEYYEDFNIVQEN